MKKALILFNFVVFMFVFSSLQAQNTRVGRWMSKKEYEAMKSTGNVQEGSGGHTYCATSGAASFRSQALKGDVYVEFEVPTLNLLQGGQTDWRYMVGPSASATSKTQISKQKGALIPFAFKDLSDIIETKN